VIYPSILRLPSNRFVVLSEISDALIIWNISDEESIRSVAKAVKTACSLVERGLEGIEIINVPKVYHNRATMARFSGGLDIIIIM
jgi:hypothetical protein